MCSMSACWRRDLLTPSAARSGISERAGRRSDCSAPAPERRPALVAAATLGGRIGAVVSRGGRPDLADETLDQVCTPTLLIVAALITA